MHSDHPAAVAAGTGGPSAATTPRVPNFLVAGAQKCGTTYLCAALSRHPDVFHSEPKELLFFQRPDVSESSYRTYLSRHFGAAGDQRWVGEGSTVYFQWPNALENVRRYLGDELRVIVCLRHPTDRAVSFYLHNVRKGRFDGSEPLAEVGSDVRMSPVLSSLYADALERWMDAYGDRMKVLLFDDLLESPTGFVEQGLAFLDLPLPRSVSVKAVNKGYGLEWDGDRLTLAADEAADGPRPSFTRSQLEDLHARFADDVARTQALLGRDLSAWTRLPEFTAKQSGW
jgi:hypothetical protein